MTIPTKQNPSPIPTVALIGRVNVGKSTLFNRLIEENKALVSSIPGTTRTRNEGEIIWRGSIIKLIDTGGLSFGTEVPLEEEIIRQSKAAIQDADMLLFVIDASVGVIAEDRELLKLLRQEAKKKPILFVANKVDNTAREASLGEIGVLSLGLGDPIPVSGGSSRNLGELLDRIFAEFHSRSVVPQAKKTEEPPIRVSIIGKPNVGKSSLFNKLIGEEKVIVSDMPHTTREPHDTLVIYEQTPILFVDTAGIRRKAKVSGELESIGVGKSIQVLENSDIILLVLDGSAPLSSQDMQLGGLIERRAKSVIILMNKWDLSSDNSDTKRNETKRRIYSYFPHLDFAPILFVSGLTAYRVQQIFPAIVQVWQARHTRIPDEALALFLKHATYEHRPSRGKGTRHPEIKAMRQIDVNPPVFELFIKYRTSLHPSYLNFLERKLREQFDFYGTPLILKLTKLKR